MLHQGLAFKGFTLEATDGKIGTVADFLFDDGTWKLRWLVVDTGGWLMSRKVLLHPSAIDRADIPAGALLVKLTRDQVAKSPVIGMDEPVSRQMEENLYGYYGVDPLWGGGINGAGVTVKRRATAEPARVDNISAELESFGPGDKHLRSLVEVSGYRINASDGEMGHVESFLIDDETWHIRYLVADTRNWWFGRHVLLSPACIVQIEWDMHRVDLNLTCYKIKGSPPWEPTSLLDRAYEQVLQAYYEWPARVLPQAHGTAAPAAAAAAPPAQLETAS